MMGVNRVGCPGIWGSVGVPDDVGVDIPSDNTRWNGIRPDNIDLNGIRFGNIDSNGIG